MSFFKPFTTKALGEAISESIKRYEQAEDKTEFCDPDVPITLLLNGKRANKYFVLSYGGDPKEEGLILDIRPLSYFEE